MKRRFLLIPAAILAVFLDSFVIPSLSGGVRPLFTLSLALAATSVTKVQDALPIAFFGGLLTDLFCNPYLGLTAAAYLIAVAIQYGFLHKRGTKLLLVPLCALVAVLAAEALIFGFSLVIGGRFDPQILLRATLPSVVSEALLTLPLSVLFDSREKGGMQRS